MFLISHIIPIVPLILHISYAVSTVEQLPMRLGQTVDTYGTSTIVCLMVWAGIVLVCNAAFVFFDVKMPIFKDAFLYLRKAETNEMSKITREKAVQELQNVARMSLFCLNVFFVGAYQFVYQTNTYRPVLSFPLSILFIGFIVTPLLIAALYFVWTALHFSLKMKQPNSN